MREVKKLKNSKWKEIQVMINKKIKRVMCGLVTSLCLVGSTTPVFAETVPFDITVPVNITVRQSRQSGVARATWPD